MFEDDLEEDFLTSWKPTKMDVGVGLDLDNVLPGKANIKKAFASSKMKTDFDFDGGFNKLLSFDIDSSFDTSPRPQAKKAKKTDATPTKKPGHEGASDFELDFRLRYDTLELEQTFEKEPSDQAQKSNLSGQRMRTSDVPQPSETIVDDRKLSESIGAEADYQGRVTVAQDKVICEGQSAANKNDTNCSSSFEPVADERTHFVDDKSDNCTSSNCKFTKTDCRTNLPAHHTISDVHAVDSWTPTSHCGTKKSQLAEQFKLVLDIDPTPVEECLPQFSKRLDTGNQIPRTNCSDKDFEATDSIDSPAIRAAFVSKREEQCQTTTKQKLDEGTWTESSKVLPAGKNKADEFLDLQTSRSCLLFDPLSSSSQCKVREPTESDGKGDCGENKKLETAELAFSSRAEKVDIIVPGLGERAKAVSITKKIISAENSKGLHSTVQATSNSSLQKSSGSFGPESDRVERTGEQFRVTMPLLREAPTLDSSRNRQVEGEDEVGSDSNRYENAPSVPIKATHMDMDTHSSENQASATCIIPMNTEQKSCSDQLEGKKATARNDGTQVSHLNSKAAPTEEANPLVSRTERRGAHNQVDDKVVLSKRPASALLRSTHKVQRDPQQTSFHLNEEQGESGVSAKAEKRQIADHSMEKLPTLTSTQSRTQLLLQSSGINTLRNQNPLSSRPLTSSKFFPTSGLKATEMRDRSHQTSNALGRSNPLRSSLSIQTRIPTLKASALSGNVNVFNKLKSGTSEVASHKGKHIINRQGRENGSEKSQEMMVKQRPQSNVVHVAQQSSSQQEYQVEGTKLQAENTELEQQETVHERLHGENVHEQNLPTAEAETEVPAQSPVGLLISQSSSVVQQANQHTDQLDLMLKDLKKLNGGAKDLLVRALVTNNKLMMLNSPMTEDRIQNMKASLMDALRADNS